MANIPQSDMLADKALVSESCIQAWRSITPAQDDLSSYTSWYFSKESELSPEKSRRLRPFLGTREHTGYCYIKGSAAGDSEGLSWTRREPRTIGFTRTTSTHNSQEVGFPGEEEEAARLLTLEAA